MAAIPIQEPVYVKAANQEPNPLSIPAESGASFKRGDFLVYGTGSAPPQVNTSYLVPPPAPGLSLVTSGGTLAAGTYSVRLTYVTALGESLPGPAAYITAALDDEINVASPPAALGAVSFNVYSALIANVGSEKLQTTLASGSSQPSIIGTPVTFTALTTATAFPSSNTTGAAAPGTPSVAASGSGSTLLAGVYLVQNTYAFPWGETVASVATSVTVTAGQNIVVTAPSAQNGALGYNTYVTVPGGVAGTEERQNATITLLSANLTITSLSTYGVQKAITGQASGLVGMAEHDSSALYNGPSAASSGFPALTVVNASPFGVPAAQPGVVMSADPTNQLVLSFGQGQELEISIGGSVAYNQGLLGSTAGISIDSSTGFFTADPTQTNTVCRFIQEVNGPNKGTFGDTGKRMIIQFLGPALVV